MWVKNNDKPMINHDKPMNLGDLWETLEDNQNILEIHCGFLHGIAKTKLVYIGVRQKYTFVPGKTDSENPG